MQKKLLQRSKQQMKLDQLEEGEELSAEQLKPEPAPSVKAGQMDRAAVLSIAYHNMGVEQEFLRSYPAAILSYKKAVNFAEKNLGPDDGITQNLRSVFENAKVEVRTFFSLIGGFSYV